jgi:type II secretory pathway component GspD/PulD (secretin)
MSASGLNRCALRGLVAGLLLAAQLGLAGEGPAREPAAKKSDAEYVRVVYHAKSVPITDLQNTIEKLYTMELGLPNQADSTAKSAGAQRVAFSSLASGNSMVISGPRDAVEEMRRMLEELDREPAQILLEMEVGEAMLDSAKQEGASSVPGKSQTLQLAARPANMETIGRVRLSVIDNQPAFVQMGARVPVVKGAATSSTGVARSTSEQRVGLTLGVTARVGPDGTVVTQIDVEHSQLAPDEEGVAILTTPDKKEVRTPSVHTASVQSTVSIRDGQTEILGFMARQDKKAMVIVVTPHVRKLGEAKKAR